MSDNYRTILTPNVEYSYRSPTKVVSFLAPKTLAMFLFEWKFTITIIVSILFVILFLCIWYQNDIKVWFESLGPPLEKWFKNPENDWIYLILLVVLLQVYRKYPKFFAPLTCVFVMGMMVLLCFQYNNFNTTEVVNQWLIVGLFVLPVPVLILIMVKTKTALLHWGAMGIYLMMVVLLIVINPGKMMGLFVQDNANVYVIALIGLFAMLGVYVNKHFTKDLWHNYITKLGFVLLCLLVAAFSFQYAVRFFIQKPAFSANYILMLGVIIGFIVLFLSLVLPRIRIPEYWKTTKLVLYVILCYLQDFFKNNAPMAFYILLAEVALITWYILSTQVYRKIEEGDQGKQIFNDPMTLRTISTLPVPFGYNMNYAISFWLYLQPHPSEQDSTSSLFVNILDYGGKPKVTYNAAINTLRITARQPYIKNAKNEELLNKYGDEAFKAALDAGATGDAANVAAEETMKRMKFNTFGKDVLMADLSNIPLQRWHHIVLSYNNGTFDIFLNGVLYRSVPSVIMDTIGKDLVIGADKGNKGKMCNLVFYQGGTSVTNSFSKDGKAISANKITDLYNNFVSKNPPIVSRIFAIGAEPSMIKIRPNLIKL